MNMGKKFDILSCLIPKKRKFAEGFVICLAKAFVDLICCVQKAGVMCVMSMDGVLSRILKSMPFFMLFLKISQYNNIDYPLVLNTQKKLFFFSFGVRGTLS